MASSTSTSSGPRYAPEDPTLPKPWRGLVDGSTGYLYFWNPETNVTRYERPSDLPPPPPPPGPPPPTSIKMAPTPLSSSIVQHLKNDSRTRDSSSNHVQRHASGHSIRSKVDDSSSHQNGRSDRGGDDHQPNLAPIPSSRSQQVKRHGGNHTQNGSTSLGNGISGSHGHGSNSLLYSSSQPMRSSGRSHMQDSGTGLSADAYCRHHEITIMGDNVPAPFTSFEAAGFPSEILKEARNAGFTSPTPIQAQTWPIALQSRDVVAIAKTGSGKTLGYLVPGFIYLKRSQNNPRMGPTVLVLSPTRELATQIQDESIKFGRSSRISSACGIIFIAYSYRGSGIDKDALIRIDGQHSCTLEVFRALPLLNKIYGDSMHKVLHVGPDTCAVVSNLLKEDDTEAWGVEPYDLEDADSNCKALVCKGIVRVADIKFPLPYKEKSFSLVIVSDALDYLSPKYLNKTLPELARVSKDGLALFVGYPSHHRAKGPETSKFGRPASFPFRGFSTHLFHFFDISISRY